MADGTPPKPVTPRPASGKPPANPLKQSSTHLRPGSSTAIPRPASSSAIPRTGTTARRAPPKPPTETVPRGPVEVVASSDGIEVSQVRRAVGGGPRLKGLSLRWKIVLAMVGIAVATAILIFFVVYSKAVSQLNDEIDAKGTRMVNLLASIDADYWMTAIHAQEREHDFQELINSLGGRQDARSIARVRGKEDLYKRVIDPFGETREPEVRDLLNAVLESDKWGRDLESSGIARRRYERIVRPFSGLNHLRPLQDLQKLDRSQDLLDAGVVDVSLGERDAPGVTLRGLVGVTLPSAAGGQGVTVRDIPREERGQRIMSRTFIREPAPDAIRKLRPYVSLSLEGIENAKGSLRTAIFLPIFVSVLLGTGIAIWISTLITEPIKVLISDMQEVSSGNLEHQTVARSKDEVGMLAATFNRMTTALRAAHQQEIEAKALEHDLAIASEIQSNLVPKRMLKIPGYDISAYYRPSKEVGGDYYDFIQIDEDNEGVIVADVSGKGVPGSLVMTMARAFIRMEAERSRNTSPSDSLIRANRMLAQDIKKGMFVTALYCILNKRTNEIRVASAGHNPLVVWRAGTGKIDLVNPNGIALGFDKGPVFERTIKEEKVVLGHGDRIVAYTDGVVEAMNAQNQEFSDERFRHLVQQLATRDSNQMLNLLVKTLDEHKGAAPQSDDITIVTLRYL